MATRSHEVTARQLEEATREKTHKEWHFFKVGRTEVDKVGPHVWNKLKDDANRIMAGTEGMEGWVVTSVGKSAVSREETRWEVCGVLSKHSGQTVKHMIKDLVLPGLNLLGGKFTRGGIDVKEAAVVVIEGMTNE